MIIFFLVPCGISTFLIVLSAFYIGHDEKNRTSATLGAVSLAFAIPAICMAGALLESPSIVQVANSPAVAIDSYSASHDKPSAGADTLNYAQAHKAEAEAEMIEKQTELLGRGWDVLGAGFAYDFIWHNFPSILYPVLCVAVIVFIMGAMLSWQMTRRKAE